MSLQYSTIFVALADADGLTLTSFYQQLLGRAPTKHIPAVYAEFELPGLRLGIFKPKEGNQAEFFSNAHSGSMSLCLEVANLDDAIAQLTAAGYPPPGEVKVASHGREIYAYDPAGNRLILHQAASG
jgi:predicted enzyme related to lactoylglutathione lyase